MDYYKLIISPEAVSSDLVTVVYSGGTAGVYSAMTQMLSGDTLGNSLFTGLTIPILITENINDIGYYDPFDGAILQQNVVSNFLFSATTGAPYTVYVYNTSSDFNKFAELSSYYVDWGDGSPLQTLTGFSPNYISHTYPQTTLEYEITLQQTNPWGLTKVTKTISLPFQTQTIPNPNGNSYFIPSGGNWSGIPISYSYIFSGDSNNNVFDQISSGYVSVPFYISGQTFSRLKDLEQYSDPKYIINLPVYRDRRYYGTVVNITPTFTAYTIQDVDYYDYSDGTTLYFAMSSGLTAYDLFQTGITKQEVLMNVVDQPIIQTDVYIERGKNSAYERVQRIGEVDNIGDLVNYGYGFFNVRKLV